MGTQYTIAASVVAHTFAEAYKRGKQAMDEGATMPEFRLDALYLSEILTKGFVNEPWLKHLVKQFPRAIFTNRHHSESNAEGSGGFKGTEEQRRNILQYVANAGARYVDFEFMQTKNEVIPLRTKAVTQVILSLHDFTGTPPYVILKETYREMRNCKGTLPFPPLVKIATMAHTAQDREPIIALLRQYGDIAPGLIAVAMGEMGKQTRFDGPRYLGFLTYARLNDSPAAPGQPTIKELREYWRSLD